LPAVVVPAVIPTAEEELRFRDRSIWDEEIFEPTTPSATAASAKLASGKETPAPSAMKRASFRNVSEFLSKKSPRARNSRLASLACHYDGDRITALFDMNLG
jgi:hypothetical protein